MSDFSIISGKKSFQEFDAKPSVRDFKPISKDNATKNTSTIGNLKIPNQLRGLVVEDIFYYATRGETRNVNRVKIKKELKDFCKEKDVSLSPYINLLLLHRVLGLGEEGMLKSMTEFNCPKTSQESDNIYYVCNLRIRTSVIDLIRSKSKLQNYSLIAIINVLINDGSCETQVKQ